MSKENKNLVVGLDIGTSKVVAIVAELLPDNRLNIIGMGLGPGFVGILSDVLNAYTSLGVDSLRWSLVISLGFAFVAVYCCVRGARTLKDDLARSQEPG